MRKTTASLTWWMCTSQTSGKSWGRISSPRAVGRDIRSMFKSIRWSLQLWHAGLLSLVLAGFGTAAYYGLESARYHEIDADLITTVQTLASPNIVVPVWQPGPRGFGGG